MKNTSKDIMKTEFLKTGENIKKTAWTSVIESLATVVLGILLIAWPSLIIKIIAYIVGGFFVVKGGYRIVNYFITNGKNDFFNNELLFGVISALIGIAVLVFGEQISGVFRVVVGVWIIYEALIRMNTAIKLNSAGINGWRVVLILSLLMLLAGAFITFFDNAVEILIGWIMVIVGLIGVFSDIMFIQNIDTLARKFTKIVDAVEEK